ncbi:MAG: TIGR00730 family Rossman fold protein [Desulfobacterales bacterium]|nr:MAG: TIGR00730 family Rossman fold protein [Desulfobacterales bacterium]
MNEIASSGSASGNGVPVKLHVRESNGPVDEMIHDLMDRVGGIAEKDIIREMIIVALKTGQMKTDMAALKMMRTTMKEMRFTTKVFQPYRNILKVTVFGSARTKPGEPSYDTAVALGRALKDSGYMVITGGGPGIMQAVNEGAGAEHSFGVNIRLPFEQKSNPVVDGNRKSITYKYFFNRKVAFLKESHAVVLFPGGFGTLDEAMETMTLVQTGKHVMVPLVLVDPPGHDYWERWLDFLRAELMENGYVSPEDFHLFTRATSVEEAVAHIDRFYHRYHSLRYVDDKLVLRLSSPPSEALFARLRSEYADILIPGGEMQIYSEALPEEASEAEIARLPRLVLDFNRSDFGRLRLLIDDLNAGED